MYLSFQDTIECERISTTDQEETYGGLIKKVKRVYWLETIEAS